MYRALVPTAHLEKGRQPKKGEKVVGRVLELLPSQGRVRITLKRALISSKMAIISSLQACLHSLSLIHAEPQQALHALGWSATGTSMLGYVSASILKALTDHPWGAGG